MGRIRFPVIERPTGESTLHRLRRWINHGRHREKVRAWCTGCSSQTEGHAAGSAARSPARNQVKPGTILTPRPKPAIRRRYRSGAGMTLRVFRSARRHRKFITHDRPECRLFGHQRMRENCRCAVVPSRPLGSRRRLSTVFLLELHFAMIEFGTQIACVHKFICGHNN